MKRPCFIFIFFVFCVISVFSDNEEQEEIDFLLFMPNSSNQFVNEEQALIQLDNLAKYLLNKSIVSGQIIVNGYAAFAPNDIEPVDLSRERAAFVINELHKRGVLKDLFSDPVGHGSVYLWGDNTGEDDRKPNRRVRILLGGESPVPITPEIVNAEIDIEIFDNVQEEAPVASVTPVKPIDTREEQDLQFPWWILLLLPLLLFLFLLKNRSKKPAYENAAKNVQTQIPKKDIEPVPEQISKPVFVNEPVPPPPKPEPVIVHSPPPEQVPIQKHKPIPVPVVTEIIPANTAIKINLDDEIRLRAYELSERRNWHGDYRDQDWYDAIPEISALYIYRGYSVYFEDGYWWAAKS